MKKGNLIVLTIIQFVIFVVSLGYLEYFYKNHILPDRDIKANFKETSCILLNKKITKEHFTDRYRADFLVNYNVNNTQYSRWVSGNGLDLSFTKDKAVEERLLTFYEVGQIYRCWYDPLNPLSVALIQRHNWLSVLPLILPSLIAVLALYFFFRCAVLLVKKTTKSKKISGV